MVIIMIDKKMENRGAQNNGTKEKRKPGRKPMTAEEKAAAAKLRNAEKEKASNLKPEIFIQFQGAQTDLNELTELARADFRAQKKRTHITSLSLYIKPEEHTAYYVVNEKYEGKISF